MRQIIFYLIMVAVIAAVVSATAGALANGVTCELGSYGKVVAEQQGRC